MGLYFLSKLNRKYGVNVQRLYIMNLSIIELIAALMFFAQNFLDMVYLLWRVHEYISIITQTMVRFVFYMIMVARTLDKMAVVFLSIRYNIMWSLKKAKYLILSIWLTGIMLCLTITFIHVKK